MSKTLGQQAAACQIQMSWGNGAIRDTVWPHREASGRAKDWPCSEQGDQQGGNQDPHHSLAVSKGEPEKPTSLGQLMKCCGADYALYPSNVARCGTHAHPLHLFQDDGLGDDGIQSTCTGWSVQITHNPHNSLPHFTGE